MLISNVKFKVQKIGAIKWNNLKKKHKSTLSIMKRQAMAVIPLQVFVKKLKDHGGQCAGMQ